MFYIGYIVFKMFYVWTKKEDYEMKWVVLSDLHMDFKNCTTKTARRELLKVLKKKMRKKIFHLF